MKYYKILFAMCMFYSGIKAQNKLQIDNFSIQIPDSTIVEKMNSIEDNGSKVQLFKATDSSTQKVKYLLSLFANELNIELKDIAEFDYKDYLSDLGNVEVIDVKKSITEKSGYKLKIKMNEKAFGIMYITFYEGKLIRMLFMVAEKEIPILSPEFENIYNSLTSV